MQAKSDAELLAEYANLGKEAAFAELVQRHTNLVYSSATRQIGSPALAAEVTQQVFISLAGQARQLAAKVEPDASVAGWLCRIARNVCLNHKRAEFRRDIREREAMQQLAANSEATPDWQQLGSVLDDALAELSDPDYDAVVMRFYQNQDLRSVGRAFGVSDDAAQKRVGRALDKLRGSLLRRGITGTAAGISLVISANAVQAAPAGLAVAISAAAVGTAAISTSTIAATTTKVIAMTTLQKAAVITFCTAAIGVSVYQARQAGTIRERAAADAAQASADAQALRLAYENASNELASLRLAPAPTRDPELLRLSRELARLRSQMEDAKAPEFTGTIGTIYGLKKKLLERPDKSIPEIKYMDDDKWLRMLLGPGGLTPGRGPMRAPGAAAWDVQLDDDESVRRALAQVRREAKTDFGRRIQDALQHYTTDNQGQLPSDILQLKPYMDAQPDRSVFSGGPRPQFGPDGKFQGVSQPERVYLPPVDDATLQRYEMMQTGNISNLRPTQYVVREKAPVDDDYDHLIQVGLTGYLTAGVGQFANRLGWSGEIDVAGLTPEQRESHEKAIESSRRAQASRNETSGK